MNSCHQKIREWFQRPHRLNICLFTFYSWIWILCPSDLLASEGGSPQPATRRQKRCYFRVCIMFQIYGMTFQRDQNLWILCATICFFFFVLHCTRTLCVDVMKGHYCSQFHGPFTEFYNVDMFFFFVFCAKNSDGCLVGFFSTENGRVCVCVQCVIHIYVS